MSSHRAYSVPRCWEASTLSECGVSDILASALSLLLPGTHVSLLCVKLNGVSPAPDSDFLTVDLFSRQRLPHPTCGGSHQTGSLQHPVPKPKTKNKTISQTWEWGERSKNIIDPSWFVQDMWKTLLWIPYTLGKAHVTCREQ